MLLLDDAGARGKVHEKDHNGVQRLDETCDEPDQMR